MPYEFYLPTKLLYGAGCLSALGGCALPGRKALLVTSAGQSAKRHGYLAEWKSSLPKQECVLSSMTRSRQTRPRQK